MILGLAALCLSLGAQPVSATIYHVAVDECTSGDEDGTLLKPFCAIQPGIDATADGDTVLVRPGTYTGDDNKDLTWISKNITVISRDGPIGTIILVDSASARAFNLTNHDITSQSRIEGFTMKNGTGTPGGAIRLSCASPVIRDCIFESNTSDRGGALYMSGEACAAEPNFTVEDCRFRANKTEDPQGKGGAIYAKDADLTIIGSRFGPFGVLAGNKADTQGGAIYLEQSEATITNSVIRGNWALEGGGIYYFSDESPDKLRIYDTTISANEAFGAIGGGIAFLAGLGPTSCPPEFHIERCTIKDNLCGDTNVATGGGVFTSVVETGAAAEDPVCPLIRIEDSIIVNNRAVFQTNDPNCSDCSASGGGLYHTSNPSWYQVRVCNSTFSGNEATGIATANNDRKGGAIFASFVGKLDLRNNIFWDDTADDGGSEILLQGGVLDGSYSDIDATVAGCPLADPGYLGVVLERAATETCSGTILAVDPEFIGFYHIDPLSPCRDQGDDPCGVFDIDLEDRVDFLFVDMGADEVHDP